ncbi:Rp1-like protein [Rhynchospora pubera]|uniref:Rp1-like protein n=1 Tax=Rhynchospora pubera TaxID=906938 RepID=A0AAV8GE57_9POAL|nr:Rp1-like protein [Rhynchospora pubera]
MPASVAAVAVTGLGWVASPITSRLINQGFSYVGMDIPRELMELETDILPKISLAIKSVSNSTNVPELKLWLQRLKDAYYQVEDLLDEAEYQRVCKMVKHENKRPKVHITSSSDIKPLTKFSDKVFSKLSFLSHQERKQWTRIIKLKENVKNLVKDAKIFAELLHNLPQNADMNSNAPIVSVTSSLPLSKVFGRDEDRDYLVTLLLEEPIGNRSKQSISVAAIIGRGGAGKTTLAQYVYNDERVVAHFDTRIWVCLRRKLDIIEHTKEMIQSATHKSSLQLSNFDALQNYLKKILLGSKNILLVLDDVWYDNREVQKEEDWEQLISPFILIKTCKILLTSRSAKMPVALHTRHPFILRDLKEHELISLFRHYSHLDEVNDSRLQQKLEAISVEIVAKLGRSPLATKAVASQLRTQQDVTTWRGILERANFRDVTDALMWSFQRLEEPLQRCFLYCGVFPKGTRFLKTSLVFDWCALNLIVSPDNTRRVEEIGEEYFDKLVARFFFEPNSNETFREFEYYTIHDDMHALAQSLSRDECFTIDDDKEVEIPSTVRHLSVDVGNVQKHIPNICKLEKLRSLTFFKPIEEDYSSTILNEIIKNLKKLRILIIKVSPYTTKLPDDIGTLKYLKILIIGYSPLVKQIPETVSKLYNLRNLVIPNSIRSLPKHTSNLVNLQTIACSDENGKVVASVPPIQYISNMTSLWCLPEFHVKKEKGYEIQQLGELRKLQGFLRIAGLENVEHKGEAAGARLLEKTGLGSLELVWSTFSEKRDLDLQVMDDLQPTTNLQKLVVDGYAGLGCPGWFANALAIQNLSSVNLLRCNAPEVLPLNLHSWKNCYELVLSELPHLKELPPLPITLEKITISMCPRLVFVSEGDSDYKQQRILLDEKYIAEKIATCVQKSHVDIWFMKERMQKEFVSLKQISVERNRELSDQVQVLESSWEGNTLSLKVWMHCQRERIKFIYSSAVQNNQLKYLSNLRFLSLTSCNITDGALSDCLSGLSSLEELCLGGVMSLTMLPGEEILENLKHLRVLKIDTCWLIRSLGALYALCSLEKLEVTFCPCLDLEKETNPTFELPSSLQSLSIQLGSIPSGILNGNLPNLREIDFGYCQSTPFLSIGHLTSLKSFLLCECQDIYYLEGLNLLSTLQELRLTLVPKLEINKSVLKTWPGCKERLDISNVQLLKILFSSHAFVAPRDLILEHVEDKSISFDFDFDFEFGFDESDLNKFASVEYLHFYKCTTEFLPASLRTTFSSLTLIVFEDCPELSSLPELSKSVTKIVIKGCPVLRERCRYNSEDWPKIAHIPWKDIH